MRVFIFLGFWVINELVNPYLVYYLIYIFFLQRFISILSYNEFLGPKQLFSLDAYANFLDVLSLHLMPGAVYQPTLTAANKILFVRKMSLTLMMPCVVLHSIQTQYTYIRTLHTTANIRDII